MVSLKTTQRSCNITRTITARNLCTGRVTAWEGTSKNRQNFKPCWIDFFSGYIWVAVPASSKCDLGMLGFDLIRRKHTLFSHSTRVYTRAHTHTHTLMHTHIHPHVHVRIHVRTCTCMQKCKSKFSCCHWMVTLTYSLSRHYEPVQTNSWSQARHSAGGCGHLKSTWTPT